MRQSPQHRELTVGQLERLLDVRALAPSLVEGVDGVSCPVLRSGRDSWFLSLSLCLILAGCVAAGEPSGPVPGEVTPRVEALAAGPPMAPEPPPEIEWPPPGPTPPTPAEVFVEPARPAAAEVLGALREGEPDLVVVGTAAAAGRELGGGRRLATFTIDESLVGSPPTSTLEVRADDPTDQFCTCVRLAPLPGHRYLLFLRREARDGPFDLVSVPRLVLGWAIEGDEGTFLFTNGASVSLADVRATSSGGA